jgi:hypothetical protein
VRLCKKNLSERSRLEEYRSEVTDIRLAITSLTERANRLVKKRECCEEIRRVKKNSVRRNIFSKSRILQRQADIEVNEEN